MQWKFCHNQRKCFVNYIEVTTQVWPIPGSRRRWQRWRQRTRRSKVSFHRRCCKELIERSCKSRKYIRFWIQTYRTQLLKRLRAVMIYSYTHWRWIEVLLSPWTSLFSQGWCACKKKTLQAEIDVAFQINTNDAEETLKYLFNLLFFFLHFNNVNVVIYFGPLSKPDGSLIQPHIPSCYFNACAFCSSSLSARLLCGCGHAGCTSGTLLVKRWHVVTVFHRR